MLEKYERRHRIKEYATMQVKSLENPLIFVVILINNRRDDVFACLDSLSKSDYRNYKVILLNNGFEMGFLAAACEKYAEIQIIPLKENLGYAGNNNLGIEIAISQGADWVLLLNDDTVLDSSCLSYIMKVATSNPSIGILGPMVYHFDEPDVIQSAGGLLGKDWRSFHLGQNELDVGQFQEPHEVQWVSGCAIFVRAAVIEQVGMLDMNYFLYWEEVEWCIRALKAGWMVMHVPQSKTWHKGVKRNYQPEPYVTYYINRNYLFTLAKHQAPLHIRLSAFANIIRTLLSWSIKSRWRSKRDHRNAMWNGLLDFLRHRMGPMSTSSI